MGEPPRSLPSGEELLLGESGSAWGEAGSTLTDSSSSMMSLLSATPEESIRNWSQKSPDMDRVLALSLALMRNGADGLAKGG